jgi:hypothetical protein
MEAINMQARFVSLASEFDMPRMTTSISRREIEEVISAANGDQPELVLDVRLARADGEEGAELRRVSVAWESADLEALLEQAPGDTVPLSIDLESLVRALEASDVEAHGLREKALVLTVALGVAAGGAGAAQSSVIGEGGGANTIPASYSGVEQVRGVEGAAPEGEGIPASYSGVEQVRGVEGAAPEGEGIPASYSGVEQVRGVEGAAPEGEGIPASYSGVEQVRGVEGPPVAASGDGVTISAPTLAEALGMAGAAITLTIAGAAFALRRRARPA